MAKLSLQCAIVGQIGSSFDVEIDDGEKVSKLKDAIKTKNKDDPTLKTVAAKNLQLFLAKKGNAWLPDDDPAAEDLEEGKVHTEIQALIDGKKMKEAWPIADVLDANNMTGEGRAPKSRQIHVLVVVPDQTEDAKLSQVFPTFRPYCEGLDVQHPHLSRDVLVGKLYDAIIRTNFVLLSASSGSGKTSLLTLFARKHPEISCIPIAFYSSKQDATTLLSSYGVNVCKKACDIPGGKLCVLMLDDCQRQYKDLDFWTALIKGSSSWLPYHVRFIISATHLLETDAPLSPVTFSSIQYKLTRDDFLVSDEEAHQCFTLTNGLPPHFVVVALRRLPRLGSYL